MRLKSNIDIVHFPLKSYQFIFYRHLTKQRKHRNANYQIHRLAAGFSWFRFPCFLCLVIRGQWSAPQLVESHLHLAHDGIVCTVHEFGLCGVSTAINVLHLEATFLEIPPLDTEYCLVHIIIEVGIVIEIIVRTYDVKYIWHDSDAASDISTAADGIAILTLKVLTVHVEWA